jgi:hypothetical protein
MGFVDKNRPHAWIDSVAGDFRGGGISRIGVSNIRYVYNVANDPISYRQGKNYQIITGLTGSNPIGGTLEIGFAAPFKKSAISNTRDVNGVGGVEFYTYISPVTTGSSNNIVSYGATGGFTNSLITYSNLKEIDFFINGQSEFRYLNRLPSVESQPNGWSYDSNNNYSWHYSNTSTLSPTFSNLGSGSNAINDVNYIARLMEYDIYNLELDYTKVEGNSEDQVSIYISSSLDSSTWEKINTFTQSTLGYKKFSLKGINTNNEKNYLIISASISSGNFYSTISDINIYGGYHEFNNKLTTDGLISLPNDAVFSFSTFFNSGASNSGTSSLLSKFGNGLFKKGVWENGVWNNGWRGDENFRDFDDIYQSLQKYSDITWRIKIKGSLESTSFFNKGDKVSVGNIVAIDINDNRKLLKDYYRVINKSDESSSINWIEIEINTTFPYRRIERDSDNHRIKVTKNIWLSGAFFNGYFSGVWNYGLFRGYPIITEMEDTYWIDGIYNGGKFKSGYGDSLYIIGLMPLDNCKVGNVVLTLQNNPFSTYKFLPGEYIKLTFSDEDYEYSNYYNGVFLVLKVNEDNVGVTEIEIDVLYITGTSISPDTSKLSIIGNIEKYSATGLIQNFNFYDSNRSKIKSGNNSLSSSIFRFNSWMDVNYDENRAVTIGKVFKSYDLLTKKSISRNNLYGYPTYDILSSNSYFRDSFSLDVNSYRLGTKYKIFNDFIGEYSSFNEPFDNLDQTGWTYSYNKPSDIELLRTDSIISLNVYDLETTQSYLDSGVTGDELYALGASAGAILNNNNITMNKDRYSVVEFDVVTHSNYNTDYIHSNSDYYTIESTPVTNGTFSKYSITNQLTSTYSIQSLDPTEAGYISSDIIIEDIVEIEVGVKLIGELSKLTINLVSPSGSIINLKKNGVGIGFRLVDTNFNTSDSYQTIGESISPYSMLSVQPPPYSGLYGMDKVIGQGTTPFKSNTYFWEDLISTITGNWILYISDETSTVDLEGWSLKFIYKNIIAKNNRPDISLPILHLSNLNYDISNQIVGTAIEQVYNKMSYLPISENIDHIVTNNTFRLDILQNTSPQNSSEYQNIVNKKYEYFYNKTDLMLSISGNGFMGSSSSMVILDNIKLYEVDMIPFFKYFTEDNIYKGIQTPITATAPSIDYSKSDFIFLDNINIGIDTVETGIIINNIKCDVASNIIIAPTDLSYKTPNTLAIGSKILLNPLFSGTIGIFSSNITLPPGILLSPTTGIISGIGVSLSTGDYIITMENEEGSVSFTVKIIITVAPVLPNRLIIANNDNYPVFNNVSNYTNSVITGDTLDGAQVTIGIGTNGISLQQLSTTNIAINIDVLGRINVPMTTPVGSYTIQYKICETNNPTNCSSAFALVSVASAILPLLSFYYKGIWNASNTSKNPQVNSWVDYFDANGIVKRFIVGPIENGCQLISASGISAINDVSTCTISTLTYPYCSGTTYWSAPGSFETDSLKYCGGNGTGGGSCVLQGTDIRMFDGSTKKVEELILGDKLFSKSVGGLSENEDNNDTWRSEFLTLTDCQVSVVKITSTNVLLVSSINDGLLNVSDSHIHLVKQNSEWKLLRTFELKVGDFLSDEFGNEIEIYNI